MFKTISFILFLAAVISANSYYIPEYLLTFKPDFKPMEMHKPHFKNTETLEANHNLVSRNYDALHYKLELDWFNLMSANCDTSECRYFDGRVEIDIKITEDNTDSIIINSAKLRIKKISNQENEKLLYDINEELQEIVIYLNRIYNKDELLKIGIDYTYINSRNIGLYIQNKGAYVGDYMNGDSVYALERFAFTSSEPKDARYWLPCNDIPSDKATLDFTIKVPEGNLVSSNGLCYNNGTLSGDTAVFSWRSNLPTATYLFVIHCSKYFTFSDTYTNKSGIDIPIDYYVWEEDYNDTLSQFWEGHNARLAFAKVPQMMEFLSDKFFDYPFEKYGMTTVAKFFGGMEHQTMTTIDRNWLYYDTENSILHELAHHWLGDYITCKTWADLWINEGGAMWSEALWNKHHYNQAQYTLHIQRFQHIYLAYGGIHLPPVYDLPDDMLFSYPLTYCKAGLVYNMIYDYLGEEKFLEILREIMSRYSFSSLTTGEFIEVVKELDKESQMDWDVFFEQWLKKPGHPQFDLLFNISQSSSEKYNFEVSVKQIQKLIGVPEVFKSPITFIAEDTLNLISQEFRAFINNAEEKFNFELDFIPNKVTISEHSIIAETVNNVINSVDSKAEIITGLYPNPVSSGNDFKLRVNTDNNSNLVVKLYDLLGREIKELYSGYTINNALELNISTAELTAGIYNIKIFNSKISSNLNLIVK